MHGKLSTSTAESLIASIYKPGSLGGDSQGETSAISITNNIVCFIITITITILIIIIIIIISSSCSSTSTRSSVKHCTRGWWVGGEVSMWGVPKTFQEMQKRQPTTRTHDKSRPRV